MKRRAFFAGLAAILQMTITTSAMAVTITVTTADDDDTTNGNCTLREAVFAAAADMVRDACPAGSGVDTVYVPAGTYDLALGEIYLSSDLIIEGESQLNTIIDGNNITNIFKRLGATSTVEIRDLTIRNGQPPSGVFGGALIQGSTYFTTFRNVSVRGCSTDSRGGAIYIGGGVVTLIDCTVDNNESISYGGAIYMGSGEFKAMRTTFINNSVLSDTNGGGGVLYKGAVAGSVSFEDCTFSSNFGRYGGAIAAFGEIVISGCTFFINVATSNGGALAPLGSGATTIVNSTFTNNRAGVSDPSTSGSGAAIATAGDMKIQNTTFVGNTRYTFGALEGNSLSGPGAYIKNSILKVSSGANCIGAMTSGGHNITSDTSCGFSEVGDVSGVDPLLGGLADNGGPTMTHNPLPGSPAIDGGDLPGCTWDHDNNIGTPEIDVRTDQRWYTRPWDGDVNGSFICDPGSVEYGATDLLFGDGFESGATSAWSAVVQ